MRRKLEIGEKRNGDSAVIEFLLKSFELKDEERAGWKLRGIRQPESVADHSWGTALLCWLYAPRPAGNSAVERERAVAMALLHDIAEAEMGDVATRVHSEERSMSAAEKERRERAAFEKMRDLLPRDQSSRDLELAALWEEYEAGKSETARFVRDMNLCDMCLQALLYQQGGRYAESGKSAAFKHFERLDEFFETSRGRLSTAVGSRLFAEIESRYRAQ